MSAASVEPEQIIDSWFSSQSRSGRDDRRRVLPARGEPGLWWRAAHGRLDRVERGDLADGDLGDRRLRIAHVLICLTKQIGAAQ